MLSQEIMTMHRFSTVYGAEHEEFRIKVQLFINNNILPHIEEWETKRDFPMHKLFKKMSEEGLLGIQYPKKYGGQGKDYIYSAVLCEEFGKIPSAGVSMALLVHVEMVAPMVFEHGSEWICEKFLKPALQGELIFGHAVSEKEAGSDVGNIQSSAKLENGVYCLNGIKKYVTNGRHSDVFCVLAKLSEAEQPFNTVLLLVPKKSMGVTVNSPIEKIGHYTAEICDVTFEQVEVPESHCLGLKGLGFIYQLQQFEKERIFSACRAISMSEFYLEETISFCKKHRTFGQTLLQHQSISQRLVDLRTEIELCKSLKIAALKALLSNTNYARLSAMIKLQSSRLARRVASECMHIFGARAYCNDHHIARFLRDARLFSISTGSDEIMYLILANYFKFGKEKGEQ